MAKQLYETSPVFKECFDKCEHVLQKQYSISIKDVLWNDPERKEKLSRTLYSQTSIFVVEYCLLKLWESWGVRADYVMGHSLGEFAAAVAAGALDFEDAIKLVAERSRLIDKLPEGKMLVIKADKKTVDETILEFQKIIPSFWVDYAALNSPEQTVVAGDTGNIDEFSKFCEQKSLKTITLASTHAFHSRHMDPILEAYRKIASSVKKLERGEGHPKFISGMEGKQVNIDSIDTKYWVRHTREEVRFTEASGAIQDEGCTLFLEVGPHPVLSALTMMNMEGNPVKCLPSIRRKEEEWVTILDSLSKLYLSPWKGEIDWKGFDRFYQRERASIPFYPFNSKPIWAQFEPDYAKVHPLIGGIIPTASNETVFQNSLTLKNASFVQDHVMGNTAVFPGAAFLEMCLAAGHSAIQGLTEELVMPRRPIVLKSLRIITPLALYESRACKVQTVTTLDENQENDEMEYSVGVHRHADIEDDTGNWIQHASAKFLPIVSTQSRHPVKLVDIAGMQSLWNEIDNNKGFYDWLPEVGLRFGPMFQSLERVWMSEKGLLASIKVPKDYRRYLIHPVVADAMLQGMILWGTRSKLEKKLKVPVQIGEFTWLKEGENRVQYLHCCNEENNDVLCTLLDETGTPLAQMKRVDFIETTAKMMEGMSSQQSSRMPKIWEEVWKPVRGPMQGYLTHEASLEELNYSEDDIKYYDEKNKIPKEEMDFFTNLVKITRFSILKALYALGWKPETGEIFSVDSLLENLHIQKNFRQYIQFFLRSMAKDDCSMLKILNVEETLFRFMVSPPTWIELEDALKHVTNASNYTREEYKLIMEIGKDLNKILIGEIIPLTILFPDDSSKPSAKKIYEAMGSAIQSSHPMISQMSKHLESAERRYANDPKASICRPIYRILEIGAGTGAFSKMYLEQIVAKMSKVCDIEYWYTDVSASFFITAEKYLEEYLQYIVFKKFDMEMDPFTQGFCPGYFDAITATEVFHIAKDIKKTMRSARTLLKPGGLITTMETVSQDERITFIFGLLEGYWQFEDKEFRKFHTTLTPEMWKEALTDAGFHGVTIISMYNNVHGLITAHAVPLENTLIEQNVCLPQPRHSWIILGEHDGLSNGLHRKLSNVNRKCLIIPKPHVADITEKAMHDYLQGALTAASEGVDAIEGIIYLWPISSNIRDQSKISLPFVTLMKLLSDFKNVPKTVAVLRGTCAIDFSDVVDPAPGTIIGFCKSILNECPRMNVTYIDLDPNKNTVDQLDELFMNLWVEQKLGIAFRAGLRLSPRLTVGKMTKNLPLALPTGCDRFQIALPKTKLISDLTFVDMEPSLVKENEVEVEVKAIALNFKDVLSVLKPTPAFDRFNSIGFDVSGVVVKTGESVTRVKVGDRVATMIHDLNVSCPNYLVSRQECIIPLSDRLTFAEGATLPAVFFTVAYCLIDRAKMKKGETVLIHTASGGVGLAAIQVCQNMGVNVIATAGSKRKQTYLRNLGIQHVFHSRTTEFKEGIFEVTDGRGVDIVLNSLTGPGFKEATLDVLGKNGRFIEMSKLNVWSAEEVKALRPDAFYEVVDMTTLGMHEYERLSNILGKYLKDDSLKPIPYERFDVLNIRGALNYLQKAMHIGKIICIMPEVKLEKSKFIVKTPLFNENSTYIVTGGLGGIGFAIVKWMLENGAKHVAIMSRSAPKPEITAQIQAWTKVGKHVESFQIDVGDYDKCKELFKHLEKSENGFPQVRGVMHVAGVLHDSVLENQSWDTFAETYNPKVEGSWNLHDLTKDYLLEHFVLFSSIAASFGSPGQSNHSASNAFEDCLAAYRKSIGFPATCVNWGNWGEVGVATELDIPGVRPISTAQGLLVLDQLLRTQTSQMTVMNIDSFSLLQKFLPQVKHYVDDCRLLGEAKTNIIVNSDEFWREVDSCSDREEKVNCFKKFIKIMLRNILRMEANEPIDDKANLQELGVDSLMMLEMKNSMQNILGNRLILTASQLKDCNTTEILANTLVDILLGEYDSAKNQLSHEEIKQLIRDDSNLLPETLSVENLMSKSIDQVETVLVTGATGNLGPYILSELTKRSQVQKVYCLLRPTSNNTLERLSKRLEEVQLLDLVDMEKIEVVEGDITTPKFGLSDDSYFELCEKIDAVVHCAAKADHTSKYWKASDTMSSHVRTVNVLGTKFLLEFSAERKLKHFFHASTMFMFNGKQKDEGFSEEWQDVSALDSFSSAGSMGYLVSKHIAEQLVYQAVLKGIPCKSFRFPLVAGESKTGQMDYKRNHAIIRWLTCMKIGAIHDLPAPILAVPVDICAKLSLDIFFNPFAPTDVYNLVQKQVEVEQVLVEVAERFGISMEILTYQQFMEKLKAVDVNSLASAFISLYVEVQSDVDSALENSPIQIYNYYLVNGDSYVDVSKLEKYAPFYNSVIEKASDVLLRDMTYLKKEGVFEKYGIKTNSYKFTPEMR